MCHCWEGGNVRYPSFVPLWVCVCVCVCVCEPAVQHTVKWTHRKSTVVPPIRAPGNQGFSQRTTRSPARITSPQPCSCSSSWAVSWASTQNHKHYQLFFKLNISIMSAQFGSEQGSILRTHCPIFILDNLQYTPLTRRQMLLHYIHFLFYLSIIKLFGHHII